MIWILGITLTLYTIYYAHSRMLIRLRYSNIFLGIGICLFYLVQLQNLYEDSSQKSAMSDGDQSTVTVDAVPDVVLERWRAIDAVLLVLGATLAVLGSLYIELNFTRLFEDAPVLGYETNDYIVGGILMLLVIDATRRAFGNLIAVVTIVSILYAHHWFAPYMPGLLNHTGFTWEQIIREGAVSLSGIYHDTVVGIGTTWVAIFIMFAGIAKAYGLMDWVLEVGRELGTTLRTGVVQIALIASMIMGSITGSAAANTATTGSFTIPMLKEQGIRPDFAAAMESVASSGGQMLPPIMGVAAFLMADILGVQYVQIIQAGTIPALLFYFSVGVALHLVVTKHGWTETDTTPFDKSVLVNGLKFLPALAVLIYGLVVMRLTPLSAGLYTIITMWIVALATTAISDRSVAGVRTEIYNTLKGLRDGAIEMAPLVGVLAAMGIIIEMLVNTGLAQKVSTALVSMGAGALVLVLVFAMIASILFGLGMPTPAAYILVVILVAPGIIDLGIQDITAHMFVFYFAMLSAITPPVAIAVAVGSRIGNADFNKTCVQALRIGAPGFLIPYSFIVNESLIYWSFPDTLIAFPMVLVGTVALVITTIGYDGSRRLNYLFRSVFLVLAFGALYGAVVSVALQGISAFLIASLIVIGSKEISLPLTDPTE
ncbi:TRAP-type transport system permease protein [Natronolimnohabitans innermongolicus JCM 12255]|uniref:TRAP-type transport system permease protein n=1 Tax=Natronolimnohabitans innermongolicus JCM 12255 TaxID=1227499 RepID=L9WLA0_9EURY|nr:TRAP-type transport system permease protein [Natronolimnohabitans innermongolicus JCM 12255]